MPSDSARPNPNSSNPLGITGDSKASVPVFSCLVYVRRDDESTIVGRVANLAEIEVSGNSERDVLGKVVRAFKSRVSEKLEEGLEVPLIDPPLPPRENEQVRSVPVHL